MAVYLDFADAIKRQGKAKIEEKYGNLFDMYYEITDENPYEVPMRIYPAVHYTMGGLWVDYNLMTTVPGLFAAGEANFSDHGANRLGASALMQGLADGYFVLPSTVGGYLGSNTFPKVTTDAPEFEEAVKNVKSGIDKLLSIKGTNSVDYYHKKLGKIMWDKVGMGRNETGLKEAITEIQSLREDFWKNVRVLGVNEELNQSLEKAGRVADFFELAELMAKDALNRRESCGGHFREESQTEDNEAKRDDENFSFVSAWEYKGAGNDPELHKEELTFEYCKPSQRSYK